MDQFSRPQIRKLSSDYYTEIQAANDQKCNHYKHQLHTVTVKILAEDISKCLYTESIDQLTEHEMQVVKQFSNSMSRNLGLHLHYVSIIKSPEKFETIIRDYLKQKQLKHVTTEIVNKELKKTKPRDRFFSLLNKWLQIKAKYYDARKAQKLNKNT